MDINKNEKKAVNVVSLFDGISCGMLAFGRAKIKVGNYFAFEIDKYAKAISQYQYPGIVQCGNVLDTDFAQYKNKDIDYVIGGSPCTFWSIAKKNREVDKSGIGWQLFMNFVKAIKTIKPTYFLYENVNSMPKSIREFISDELQCEPIMINSALVSAQQRKRLYWTNIKGITQPNDKGILLKDILESGVTPREKSLCIDTCYYKGGNFDSFIRLGQKRLMVYEKVDIEENSGKSMGAALRTRQDKIGKSKHLEIRKDNKCNSLTTVTTDTMICKPVQIGTIRKGGQGNRIYSIQGKTVCFSANGGGAGGKTGLYKVDLPDGNYRVRKLSTTEAERGQTFPENYTKFGIFNNGEIKTISNTQRYKCIGNGWTIDVIAHILSFAEPKGSF